MTTRRRASGYSVHSDPALPPGVLLVSKGRIRRVLFDCTAAELCAVLRGEPVTFVLRRGKLGGHGRITGEAT